MALARLRALAVFSNVRPSMSSWVSSHLYASQEPYRSLYQLHRDLRAGVAGIEGDYTSIPLRETHRLYETWVSLRLAAAAALIDPLLNPSGLFSDALESNGLTFRLQMTSVDFCGNSIYFKPVYREVWLSSEPVGSISRPMIPDIVLEIAAATDNGFLQLVVLDAKYRVNSQLNEAISSIHTYRDSLVQADGEGNYERVVRAGLVVSPRDVLTKREPTNNWKEQKAPAVFFDPAYQSEFGIGAIVLTPGVGVHEVAKMLTALTTRETKAEPTP